MNHTQQELEAPVEIEEPRVAVPEPALPSRPRLWIHGVLFLATVISTLFAGAVQQGVNPLDTPSGWIRGIPFSFTLLAILLTHEMGHYLTSRYHRVDATLPYFIPAPSFIGTFGAFIRMRSPIMEKRALLDIGASGPIAGFVVSIAAVVIGLRYSAVIPTQGLPGIGLGAPIIFQLISHWIVGPLPEGYDVILHPVAFAGWIGFFVTALNLIPIGQLDGGHVVFAVLERYHRAISLSMVPVLIAMGIFGWTGWLVWAVLPLLIGFGHPPTMNPEERLDPPRKIIGWTTLAIFVLCFTPVPFFIH
jgi:membrane-associated protease RseP (regulator of RpoE activity)